MAAEMKMTTKERIVEEALTLFARKGFKGTSVKNIADAVGIKDSSLYKHFKSKKEIFDTIIIEMRKRMGNMSLHIGLPDERNMQQTAEAYGRLSQEGLIQLSRRVFLFYLKDDFISRFWRMANIEQYQDSEVYGIFRHIFMEESIAYQTAIFDEMIKKKIFIESDPEVLAMNFYSPIFFLLSKYSGREDGEEEAIAILDRQVEEFYKIYRMKSAIMNSI